MNTNPLYDELLPNEKTVMPKQASAMNNDHYACDEFLKLKEKFNITTFLELGTCVGGTTRWACNSFPNTHSIEINEEFLNIAKERCKGAATEPTFHLGSTVDLLAGVLKKCDDKTLVLVDSHWYNHFPLMEELKIIAESGLKPCIAVHDCLVPNQPKLGYDSYNGVDISYETMKPYIDAIYGEGGYDYHYNSDETSTEVKRGIFYCYPKI